MSGKKPFLVWGRLAERRIYAYLYHIGNWVNTYYVERYRTFRCPAHFSGNDACRKRHCDDGHLFVPVYHGGSAGGRDEWTTYDARTQSRHTEAAQERKEGIATQDPKEGMATQKRKGVATQERKPRTATGRRDERCRKDSEGAGHAGCPPLSQTTVQVVQWGGHGT